MNCAPPSRPANSASSATSPASPNLPPSSAGFATLRRLDWVVYAKPPFGGPEQVLAYLGRYTHRVAIANPRLISVTDDEVAFRWKDYRHHGKTKVMTLDATSSFDASSCTPCRMDSTAFATTASSRMAIAPRSWRSAVGCSTFRLPDPAADQPTSRRTAV